MNRFEYLPLQAGTFLPHPPGVPMQPYGVPMPPQQKFEPIGDGILAYRNAQCGLDAYESCDEETWVNCQVASARISFYGFAFVVIVVMLLMFFSAAGFKKVLVLLIGIGLLVIAKYGSQAWVASNARIEYKRVNNEIIGLERRGLSRENAILAVRKEKESKDRNDAIRGGPKPGMGVGVGFGVGAAIGNAFGQRVSKLF